MAGLSIIDTASDLLEAYSIYCGFELLNRVACAVLVTVIPAAVLF
jgi:hypothetical protein